MPYMRRDAGEVWRAPDWKSRMWWIWEIGIEVLSDTEWMWWIFSCDDWNFEVSASAGTIDDPDNYRIYLKTGKT